MRQERSAAVKTPRGISPGPLQPPPWSTRAGASSVRGGLQKINGGASQAFHQWCGGGQPTSPVVAGRVGNLAQLPPANDRTATGGELVQGARREFQFGQT